jgi:hypothetical protein
LSNAAFYRCFALSGLGTNIASSFFNCMPGDHAAAKVPLTVLCVEKIVFSCGSGDHTAVERNTQRPFQENVAGKRKIKPF